MKYIFYAFLVILACTACHKEILKPIPSNPNSDSSILKPIWNSTLLDGKEYIPSAEPPSICGEKVVFSRFTIDDPRDLLVSFNTQTGEKMWSWDDPEDIYDGGSISDHQSGGINLALCSSHQIYWIDAQSGTTIWKTDAGDEGGNGMPRMEVIDGKIYHNRVTITSGDCCENQNSHLVVAPIETGKWDTLYTVNLSENEGYASSFESYTVWQNPQTGDSILLFNNRQYNWDNHTIGQEGGRSDVIGFNLKTRKVEWKTRINDPIGGSSVKNMLVHGDKVYFMGQTLFSCLDLFDGSIVWQKLLNDPQIVYSETLFDAGMAIADGKLLLKPDDENFYALDPNTGGEIWHVTDAGHSPGHLEVYKDLVIYASIGLGDIWIHQVSDGKLLEKFTSPHKTDPKYPGAAIAYSMAIDPKTGFLYTSDGYFAMCFRIDR
jgi:outer membrane protein assembly factor BamB